MSNRDRAIAWIEEHVGMPTADVVDALTALLDEARRKASEDAADAVHVVVDKSATRVLSSARARIAELEGDD